MAETVAFCFAETLNKPENSEEKAWLAAQKEWCDLFSSEAKFGRKTASKDVYWLQIVPENDRDTLPSGLPDIAKTLYLPLLKHSTTVKLSALAQEFNNDGN